MIRTKVHEDTVIGRRCTCVWICIRPVPLSEEAKRLLRALDSVFRSAWVFLVPTKPMNSRAWHEGTLSRHSGEQELLGVSFHSLRHTCASRKIMAGADLIAVKEILGHRDIETTMRYTHVSGKHLSEAANKGSFLGAVSETVANLGVGEGRAVE